MSLTMRILEIQARKQGLGDLRPWIECAKRGRAHFVKFVDAKDQAAVDGLLEESGEEFERRLDAFFFLLSSFFFGKVTAHMKAFVAVDP